MLAMSEFGDSVSQIYGNTDKAQAAGKGIAPKNIRKGKYHKSVRVKQTTKVARPLRD